ncbi:hypothetical protein V8F20_010279 [Naviculisporaceae sp. PSN 640]
MLTGANSFMGANGVGVFFIGSIVIFDIHPIIVRSFFGQLFYLYISCFFFYVTPIASASEPHITGAIYYSHLNTHRLYLDERRSRYWAFLAAQAYNSSLVFDTSGTSTSTWQRITPDVASSVTSETHRVVPLRCLHRLYVCLRTCLGVSCRELVFAMWGREEGLLRTEYVHTGTWCRTGLVTLEVIF